MKEKSYYGKLCTLVYDLDKLEPPADEFSVLKSSIKTKNGLILEAMCGTGRFIIPMLKMGYKVEGVDISEDMLKALFSKLKKEGLKANLYQASVLNFRNNKEYDYIFISSGSLSVFVNEKTLFDVLSNLYFCLKKDHPLVLSYINPTAEIEESDDYEISKDFIYKGKRLIEYCKEVYDSEDKIIDYHLRYELLENNLVQESEEMVLQVKLFSFDYLCQLLSKVGFRNIVDLSEQLDDHELSYLRCYK